METSSSNDAIKNSQLLEYNTHTQKLNKWSIPKVKPTSIYKIGMFDFTSRMVIKTMEQSITLENNDEILRLLESEDTSRYRKNFKFLHISCVQVAFKPLTLLGINACLQASLRDGRSTDWSSSLMGIIETSLCHGPVFFNVYPNLPVSLTDRNINDALTLRVQTQGYNFLPGTETVAVIYRVYF